MKTVKIETTIKNIMISFVKEHGLLNIEASDLNHIEYSVSKPTRFHYGQIHIAHPQHGIWVADYTQSGNLSKPKQIVQIATGAWVGVNHPLAQKGA